MLFAGLIRRRVASRDMWGLSVCYSDGLALGTWMGVMEVVESRLACDGDIIPS